MDLSYYFSNIDFEPFSCQSRAVTSTDADYQEFSRLNLSLSTNVTLHNPKNCVSGKQTQSNGEYLENKRSLCASNLIRYSNCHSII